MRVMGVDPGGTTGVVVRDSGKGAAGLLHFCEIVAGGEFERECLCVDAMLSLVGFWSVSVVVIEDFILRLPAKSSDRVALSPVRIGAMLGYALSSVEGVSVVWQSPSDAKSVITNARLRAVGMWVKGSEHCRDASRHAELYLRRAGSV